MKKVFVDEIIAKLEKLKEETAGDSVSVGKVLGAVHAVVKEHAISFEEKTELAAAAAAMDGLSLDEALDLAEMKKEAADK